MHAKACRLMLQRGSNRKPLSAARRGKWVDPYTTEMSKMQVCVRSKEGENNVYEPTPQPTRQAQQEDDAGTTQAPNKR